MAKKSMIAREKVRIKLSTLGNQKRASLRKIIKDNNVEYEEKINAVTRLNKRERDESKVRIQRRCASCGRSRGVYRKFRLCRICLRQAMMRGDVPGLVKASW